MGDIRPTGYLNGLRALSALWVLVAHCLIWSGYEGFIPNAKVAVAVFMVLSGYLMAHTCERETFQTWPGWRGFYLKRFFRIAPLYYLVLAFVALSPWVRDGFAAWGRFSPGGFYSPEHADFSLGNLALHASFLFGLSRETSTNTLLPDWSLSLEMQFYAAFPLIWIGVRRFGALRTCATLAVLCLPIWALTRTSWHDPSALWLQLPYFLAGILAFEGRKSPPLIVLALLLAAFEAQTHGAQALVIVGAIGIIAALDRWRLPALRAVLDNPVSKVGADVSFGVYLIHGPMIAAAGFLHPPLWALLSFVLTASVAISYALHWAVERPAIRLGRRVQYTP